MKPEPQINRRREEFPTLASGIHLLSHSLGPVPRGARASMSAYVEAWEHHTSEDAWASSWWEMSTRVGDRIGAILGGAPGSVQIQPNASIALSSVASCFDFKASDRNKIVTSALDFPSMEYVWDAQARVGARIEIIPSDDGITVPLERILNAIDDTTCLVALSHVSFRSSYRVDAAAIVERAHQHGALVLLDVYQSAGAVELQASDWEVDFLIGGTIKWLCGGPACGYLYVRPDLQKGSRAAFDRMGGARRAVCVCRAADALRRFSAPLCAGHAQHSRALFRSAGSANHRRGRRENNSSRITAAHRMDDRLCLEQGWKVNSPRDVNHRGASVMIYVDDGPAMVTRLNERKVFVDCRPGVGLRISPHFFNTDEEVREAMGILAQLI